MPCFYQIYPQTFCDSDGDGIGDKFPITRDRKTGKVTITMPPVSYAIVKL